METKTIKQVDLFGVEIPQKESKVISKKEAKKAPREIPQEQPVSASFTVNRRELMYGLKMIKRPVKIARMDVFSLKFELFVMEDEIILRLYENQYHIPVETSGTCSTELYYHDVMEALKSYKDQDIEIAIRAKTISINKILLTSSTQSLSKRKTELPISVLKNLSKTVDNFTPDPDKNLFTLDKQKGFYFATVDEDVNRVKATLQKYNIPTEEIWKFVNSYLIRKSSF